MAKGFKTVTRVAQNNAAGGTLLCGPNNARASVTLKNVGTVNVAVGAGGVTYANGRILEPLDELVDTDSLDQWRGITSTATAGDISVIEVTKQSVTDRD